MHETKLLAEAQIAREAKETVLEWSNIAPGTVLVTVLTVFLYFVWRFIIKEAIEIGRGIRKEDVAEKLEKENDETPQ